jgi:hypothetical protein
MEMIETWTNLYIGLVSIFGFVLLWKVKGSDGKEYGLKKIP